MRPVNTNTYLFCSCLLHIIMKKTTDTATVYKKKLRAARIAMFAFPIILILFSELTILMNWEPPLKSLNYPVVMPIFGLLVLSAIFSFFKPLIGIIAYTVALSSFPVLFCMAVYWDGGYDIQRDFLGDIFHHLPAAILIVYLLTVIPYLHNNKPYINKPLIS